MGGKDKPQVLRLALEGANPHPASQALEGQAARSAYFLGNDPARWHTGVAHYGRVRYKAVYPGIDLVYYGAGRHFEFGDQKSSAKPLQDLIVLKQNATNCRRPA